ncbi:MAG: hypothetical protein U5L04_09960 [Trueperaceae bacterium]|nr:hypothetical protein [Trueperaceae bacterium]
MSKRRELRVIRDKETFTFSPGVVVESLQGIGVPTDEAIRIAKQLEKYLKNRDERDVQLEELVEQLIKLLAKTAGPGVAERYRQQTPPFVPLLLETDGALRPFSRRILATSLQKLELSFKEAYATARQVEQTVRTEGLEQIDERELSHLVAQSLESRFGRGLRLRYEASTDQATDLLVREADGVAFPYSRGILAQSLMAVGLGPEMSHNFAKRTEDILWRRQHREVSRDTVRDVVKTLLLSEAGEEFARRYELMRSVRRPRKPIVVLIGGAPGVGKSTLASELAYRLGISRIVSSDSVRQALRSLISAEFSPTLHSSSFTAWRAELLPSDRATAKPKRKRVARGFQRQAQQLNTAMLAIVERNIQEMQSLVIEGIHLVPGLMPLDTLHDVTVVELVISVGDEEVHRSHFSARDTQTQQRRGREHYLAHFEEIRMLQDFTVDRAKREGVAVIEVSDFDHAVDQAVERVLEAVLAERLEEHDEAGSGSDEEVGDRVEAGPSR